MSHEAENEACSAELLVNARLQRMEDAILNGISELTHARKSFYVQTSSVTSAKLSSDQTMELTTSSGRYELRLSWELSKLL